jgi:hypothetical protein
MSLKLDKELFLMKTKSFASSGEGARYKDEQVRLGRQVVALSQLWIDGKPWRAGVDFSSQKAARKELKKFINKNIRFSDYVDAKFIPPIVFWWLATQLISYLIKLIIEWIWRSVNDDLIENPL